eukprot:CAMPEP_0172636074 /NCGR_PEP_ID=MMETSP1068-20121228/202279_1 /TAXON_ID=35684 /ORGANISM="Pseudopedinella elastica, Strain CCMP716" /LENGTH=140 /DNA_ID=CAMNT_0013448437 /DNA_START=546 /DNA_END=972 /DNA_ORIENTATION=+
MWSGCENTSIKSEPGRIIGTLVNAPPWADMTTSALANARNCEAKGTPSRTLDHVLAPGNAVRRACETSSTFEIFRSPEGLFMMVILRREGRCDFEWLSPSLPKGFELPHDKCHKPFELRKTVGRSVDERWHLGAEEFADD